MHRAYVETQFINNFLQDNKTQIPEIAWHRLVNIVRAKSDEKVALFDGNGKELQGYISSEHKNLVNHSLVTKNLEEKKIILVQALLEEKKLKDTVIKATEFGIYEIILVPFKRCEPFLISKIENKLDKLHKYAIDASRQCGRYFVPNISIQKDLTLLLDLDGFKIFGHIGKDANLLSETLVAKAKNNNNFYVFIGPEGGFSLDESSYFIEKGIMPVAFSPYILKSELACLSAISIINSFLKRA